MLRFFSVITATVLLATCGDEREQTRISDAWVRATAPGQKVAAAYLTLQSGSRSKLVRVDSSVAAKAELHSMRVEEGVMRMRQLDSIELPPGATIKLEPGGDHLMLIDVAKPLATGDKVPLVLTLKRPDGSEESVKTVAEVRER
jgi:copper(I)-binding protein